ncbi:hypothetical protein Sxan_54370 [Streptomyces xanthophaeus]|uniref:Uncharacterized protein n=1 Tax=Streptomyces xanthophaeus TaxID=67385 RepID=A0A919H7K1_9ACTN|nr:hypothetical protein Sxan_54370 [Streptomyces xanthophaeus]
MTSESSKMRCQACASSSVGTRSRTGGSDRAGAPDADAGVGRAELGELVNGETLLIAISLAA